MYPADQPRRPLAKGSFIPVADRAYSIGQVELLEPLHDAVKMTFDQMADRQTIANTPWFFYRRHANIPSQSLKMSPGAGIPLPDPKNDVVFQQFPNSGESYGFNVITMLSQFGERASMQGDLQFGSVPKGRSSALRTTAGITSVLQQGDARPERILRRFFLALADAYQMVHELNQRFLPAGKEYHIAGAPEPGQAVYATIDSPQAIAGRMRFTFGSSILNTNKQLAQQALGETMAMLVNPLMLQLGLSNPQTVYAILRDALKFRDQDPDQYLNPPSPEAALQPITAAEAFDHLVKGIIPRGTRPAEPPDEHLQQLAALLREPPLGPVNEAIFAIAGVYGAEVQQAAQEAAQQQQLLANAQQFQQQAGGGAAPGGATAPNLGVGGNPAVNSGELLDETIEPSA